MEYWKLQKTKLHRNIQEINLIRIVGRIEKTGSFGVLRRWCRRAIQVVLGDDDGIKTTASETSSQPWKMSQQIQPTRSGHKNGNTIGEIGSDDNVEHRKRESFTRPMLVVLYDLGNATTEIANGSHGSNQVTQHICVGGEDWPHL